MLVKFSIVPIGTGSSIGDYLAEVLDIVDKSGLPYKVNPMGTVIEGEWQDVISLIKKCYNAVMSKAERAILSIAVDDKKGRPNRIEEAVKYLLARESING